MLISSNAWRSFKPFTPAEILADSQCKYTRDDCIDCATRHADLDHDGRINATEVDLLKSVMLVWWETGVAWWFDYSTPAIMHRCGDAEGYITPESVAAHRYLCLRHCADWMHFMPLCMRLDEKGYRYPHHREMSRPPVKPVV